MTKDIQAYLEAHPQVPIREILDVISVWKLYRPGYRFQIGKMANQPTDKLITKLSCLKDGLPEKAKQARESGIYTDIIKYNERIDLYEDALIHRVLFPEK